MGQAFQSAAQAFKRRDYASAERLCLQAITTDPGDANAHNLLGVICGTTGRHGDASAHMQRSVDLAPDRIDFRKNLATAFLSQHDYAAAEKVLRAIKGPVDASVLSLLGTALGGQGQLDEGIDALCKALMQMPDSPTLNYNLGELYRRNGKSDNAIEHFKRVLTAQPNHVDALNNLSGILLDQGEFIEALRCIEQMLRLNPKSAQAYANLGTVMRAAGDLHESVKAVRNAIRLDSDQLRYKFQLANMLVAVGRLDEADEIMDDLRRREPDRISLRATHAKILERKGRVAEAAEILEAFDEETKLSPDNATILSTVLDQLDRTDEAIELLEEVLRTNETVAMDGISIQFLLAQYYDSTGRYDDAFAMLRKGNDNRRGAFYQAESAASATEVVSRLTKIYSPSYYGGFPSSNVASDKPVFIIGMPRSGTSLTEQILASHSQVHGAGELSHMNDLVSSSHESRDEREVGKRSPFSIVEDDPSGEVMGLLPKGWESPKAEILDPVAEEYLRRIESLGGDATRVVDKMPYNFLLAPLIKKVFPNSRIIHTKRHPLDTCLSCYFQNFAAGNQYAFELSELGNYYANYLRLMNHWRQIGVEMLEINYEDLVANPEEVARQMLDFCQLEWEPHVLDFHKSKRIVTTASYQQVRQPVYQKSSGRWRNYESHLGELIASLGIGPELLDQRSPNLGSEKVGTS